MTNNKMKKEFDKLGYELSYEYKSWHIRKRGTTEFKAIGCKESAEEYLIKMQEGYYEQKGRTRQSCKVCKNKSNRTIKREF